MLIVNIEKAKKIGHDLRREKRNNFFAPYDKIIQLNIPGQESQRQEAEAKRVLIRASDAKCQADIDAAITPEEIKQALESFVDA